MNDLATKMLSWLLEFYLSATVILVLSCCAVRAVRQPAKRIALAWAALLGIVFLAIASLAPFWPRESLHVVSIADAPPAQIEATQVTKAPPPEFERSVVAADRTSRDIAIDRRRALGAAPTMLQRASTAPPSGWAVVPAPSPYLPCIFLAAQFTIVLWLAAGWVLARRLVGSSHPAPSHAQAALRRVVGRDRRAPQLRVSHRLDQPLAVGLLRPMIVIPAHFLEVAGARALEGVLRHESAHIRRGDLWLLALCRWLTPLLFAHPCYWWLRRQISLDQELLADAAAVSADSRVAYAEMLLAWSKQRRNSFTYGLPATMFMRGSLKRRVAALLDRNARIDAVTPGRWKAGSAGLVGLVAIGLSCLSFCGASGLSRAITEPVAIDRTRSAIAETTAADIDRTGRVPLVAYLTSDVTLEVVGVRQHPCIGRNWWNPNGASLVETALAASDRSSMIGPEIVVRVRNPQRVPLDWDFDSADVRVLDENTAPFGEVNADGRLIAISLPASGDVADLSLRVGVGPWQMRNSSGCALDGPSDRYRYSTCNDAGDSVVVSVTHPLNREEIQLVAFDVSGREHHPVNLLPQRGELTAAFDNLPLDEIQEFCVQTRQQRSVEFRNISLVPGQLTDAQVVACEPVSPGV